MAPAMLPNMADCGSEAAGGARAEDGCHRSDKGRHPYFLAALKGFDFLAMRA
jgi:hypothetical protein